jgi:hypothetical protein
MRSDLSCCVGEVKSLYVDFENYFIVPWGTRWRSWLRHCATSRKVMVSIPDGVSGIFH